MNALWRGTLWRFHLRRILKPLLYTKFKYCNVFHTVYPRFLSQESLPRFLSCVFLPTELVKGRTPKTKGSVAMKDANMTQVGFKTSIIAYITICVIILCPVCTVNHNRTLPNCYTVLKQIAQLFYFIPVIKCITS
jgi:ABC-type xylose transport system permease subunit